MKKFFTLLTVASMATGAFAQTVSPSNEEVQLVGEGMSHNTQYVVGTNYVTFAPAVWCVSTDKVINFTELEEAQFHGVSNAGVIVGSHTYAIKANLDGTVVELYADKGNLVEDDWGSYYDKEAGSDAWNITPDGKYIVGDYFDNAYKTIPCVWTADNQRIDLPMPDFATFPFEIDGAGARWISDDGKVILGYVNDNFGTWPAVYWTMNDDGTYTCHPLCTDYYGETPDAGKPYMFFTPTALSGNGEWITLQVAPPYDMFNWEEPKVQCARMNLKTMQIETFGDGSEVFDMAAIANNGTAVGYLDPGSMFGRIGTIWFPHKEPTIVNNIFPGNDYFDATLGGMGCNTPCFITPDASCFGGFAMANEDDPDITSYIMDLPEPTAIPDVVADKKQNSDVKVKGTFDLNGRRLQGDKSKLAPGIYVIDGKKEIVR